MMQLHRDLAKFNALKINIVAVCPENYQSVVKFSEKTPLDFSLVADNKHVVADQYNQQVNWLKLGRMPAQIILDKNGTKVFQHYANSMADIVENDAVLDAIKTL